MSFPTFSILPKAPYQYMCVRGVCVNPVIKRGDLCLACKEDPQHGRPSWELRQQIQEEVMEVDFSE